MTNIVLSTRNIDDFISDIATEVVKRIENCKVNSLIQEPSSDKWFNLSELCDYLPDKPKKVTVYSWITSNSIPSHKGQKKLRFLKSEIDLWLKAGRKKTSQEIEKEAETFIQKMRVNNV